MPATPLKPPGSRNDQDPKQSGARKLAQASAVSGRRSGYRPGRQLSPKLEAALDAEASRLAAINDPVEAINTVTGFFSALDDALEAVAEPRLAAVKRMYDQGKSYGAIADATLLSKSRVADLYRTARRRGL